MAANFEPRPGLLEDSFVDVAVTDDDFIVRLHGARVENRKLREQVLRYRVGLAMLVYLAVLSVTLALNRAPPPLHLTACAALKYYLLALDEVPPRVPEGTRRLLDVKAAACPDEDFGDPEDDKPHL